MSEKVHGTRPMGGPLRVPYLQTIGYQRNGALLANVIPYILGGPESRIIRILEEEAGAIHLEVQTAKGTYEVMANMRWEGRKLILDRTHIWTEGGPGSLGAGLRSELRRAAEQFMKQRGATEIVVNSGKRLGGLGYVSPITIKVIQ
jgi:hypothetical protein